MADQGERLREAVLRHEPEDGPPTAGKIIYVIQHRDVSGAEHMHAPVIQRDLDALVACPPNSRSERFARDLGASTVPLNYRPLRISAGPLEAARSLVLGLRTARDLRSVLRSHPTRRIIYCTSHRPAMIGAIASIGLRRRILWCAPDMLPPPPLRNLTRLLARRATRILCLSGAIRANLIGRSGRLRRRASVVHPGVDLARYPTGSGSVTPRAAIVGHISPTKRTDLAIDVARMVAQEFPAFRLRVVGRAQFRDEDFALERSLRDRVSSDPLLSEVVEFAGYREDVGAALADCGLLLHCRPVEPFGIALIEGMARGLPVVAPASAGPLEIVENGITGLLYPPGDVAAAARCVSQLLANPEEAKRMGRAARTRVEEHFSVEQQLEQTWRLLADLA